MPLKQAYSGSVRRVSSPDYCFRVQAKDAMDAGSSSTTEQMPPLPGGDNV